MRAKKKMKTRTKFVICSVVNITWYTIAVLVFSWFDKTVPDALTYSFYGAWTAELAFLAGITIKSKEE